MHSAEACGFHKIVAVSPEKDATSLADFKNFEQFSLVFGTEKEKVTDEILNFAHENLAMPMLVFSQSFNVSVAMGICFI